MSLKISLDEREQAIALMGKFGVAHPSEDVDQILDFLKRNEISDKSLFNSMIDRRSQREPLERILGVTTFLDKEFKLSPSVFRSVLESEATVEHALICAQSIKGPIRILDLGCGNGCMLVTLLLHLENAIGVGVDINPEAINLSKENAEKHGVSDRAKFILSDWGGNLTDKFDIIISNPPRIPSLYLGRLVFEVSKYDPHDALDGGEDGLEFYRRTINMIPKLTKNISFIIMQIGNISSQSALSLFHYEGYTNAKVGRDYKYQSSCIILTNQKTSSFWNFTKMLINLFGGK